MALPELLQWLAEGNKTGALRLDNGTVEKRVHFADGHIVSTSSSDPKEHLGHFLVSHGYITEQELVTALDMQESNNMLLGQILLSIGVMNEEVLERMLYLKSEETLYELFTWTEGEFQFIDNDLPDRRFHPIDLSVTSVILRGTQRLDEWRRIRDFIPSDDSVVVSVGAFDSNDAAEAAILAAINDDRTIAEIAMLTHSSEFYVCKFLLAHIESGTIKVVRPRSLSAPNTEAITATSSDRLILEAQRRLAARDYGSGLRHLRAARSLDPDNRDVARAIKEGEERIRDALTASGIELTSVPRISEQADEGDRGDISSGEGFLLSRVDGRTDLKTILVITPMDPLEAQLAFLHLRNAGYIEIG